MSKLTLKDRLRSRSINRWHSVAINQNQNIAEHSHCMGIIAEDILERLHADPKKQPSIEDRYAVIKYPQLHDLPEIVTGDMTSVFKRFLVKTVPGFNSAMEAIEEELVPELASFKLLFIEKPYLGIICRAADILEALSSFIIIKGNDTEHNDAVFNDLNNGISSLVSEGQETQPLFNWTILFDVAKDIEHGKSNAINFESKLKLVIAK